MMPHLFCTKEVTMEHAGYVFCITRLTTDIASGFMSGIAAGVQPYLLLFLSTELLLLANIVKAVFASK
jgi:hypothetical protein